MPALRAWQPDSVATGVLSNQNTEVFPWSCISTCLEVSLQCLALFISFYWSLLFGAPRALPSWSLEAHAFPPGLLASRWTLLWFLWLFVGGFLLWAVPFLAFRRPSPLPFAFPPWGSSFCWPSVRLWVALFVVISGLLGHLSALWDCTLAGFLPWAPSPLSFPLLFGLRFGLFVGLFQLLTSYYDL